MRSKYSKFSTRMWIKTQDLSLNHIVQNIESLPISILFKLRQNKKIVHHKSNYNLVKDSTHLTQIFH